MGSFAFAAQRLPCKDATRQVGESAEAAIVRLITLLTESREIALDDLAQYAMGNRLVNPIDFALNIGLVRRLVFGQAFEKLMGEVYHRGHAWTYIRRELKGRVIPQMAKEQGRRGGAEKETRNVKIPILIEELKPYPGGQGVHPNSMTFRREGKDYLAYPGGNSTLVVMDLSTMTPRSYPLDNATVTTPPSYYEEHGQGFLIYHSFHVRKLNLDTGEFKMMDETYSQFSRSVMTKDGPRVVTSSKEGATGDDDDEGISIAHPSDPAQRAFMKIDGGSGGPLAAATLKGKPHVALITKDGKGCAIVDVEGRKVTHTIPIKGHSHEDYVPQFYDSKAGPRLVIPADKHFVIADPLTGKEITRVKGVPAEAHELTIFEEKGEKRALYATKDKIVLLDLETGQELRRITAAEEVTTPPRTFEFQGSRYFTWGTSNGNLVFMDAASKKITISERVASRNLREVIPVVHDNRVEAIVITRNSSEAVLRMQLIGPPRKVQ